MDITLKQLRDSFGALQALAQIEFKAKTAYRLGRILDSAVSEINIFNKAHLALIEKHGAVDVPVLDDDSRPVLDEQGQPRTQKTVPKDKLKEFEPEFLDLLTGPATLWGEPLHIDLLGEVEIAPAILAPLDWLIVDGSEKAEKPKSAAASGD